MNQRLIGSFQMLHSLKSSSSSSHHDDDSTDVDADPPPHIWLSSSAASGAPHRLLFSAAELVAQSDFPSAHRLVSLLSSNSSPYGDSTERLVHQFAKALSVRISRHLEQQYQPQPRLQPQFYDMIVSNSTVFTSSICKEHFLPWTNNNNNNINSSSSSTSVDDDFFQSCYLWVNQITPFIRFSHLTANQAILDATETTSTNHAGVGAVIHILDLDITQGLQWPPFMQALAERSSTNPSPVHAPSPPILRITGCGRDLTRLNRTGDRLTRFAHSLGLRFQFHPLLLHDDDPASLALRLRDPDSLSAVPEEILAVNCVHYLHNLVTDDPRDIRMVLSAIKALNPRIVTAAEREANHGATAFAQRFSEAVDHYAAVFESLEATLPPNSRERLTLEQWWFGREIMDIIAAEEAERRQRHQRYEVWEAMFRSSGFCNVPIGGFALSQAKLLLRLHYPSEGYKLQSLKNSLFLGQEMALRWLRRSSAEISVAPCKSWLMGLSWEAQRKRQPNLRVLTY